MGSFIARQPNGKLCRFSSIADTITHYNMSDEDYIELCAEMAREEARSNLKDPRFIHSFQEVIDSFQPANNTEEEFLQLIQEMSDKGKTQMKEN